MKISSQLLILLPLVFAIGVLLTLQTAINTQLKEYLYSPIQAAFFSFLIGTIVLAGIVLFQSHPKPGLQELIAVPWYLWLGGFLGVYAISMSTYAAPNMGFLPLPGMLTPGHLALSMIVDPFGLPGTEKMPVNWQRLLGGVVIFIGVLLTLQR